MRPNAAWVEQTSLDIICYFIFAFHHLSRLLVSRPGNRAPVRDCGYPLGDLNLPAIDGLKVRMANGR